MLIWYPWSLFPFPFFAVHFVVTSAEVHMYYSDLSWAVCQAEHVPWLLDTPVTIHPEVTGDRKKQNSFLLQKRGLQVSAG